MIPELPPVASILRKEELWKLESAHELKQRLRSSGLLRELQRQAAWTLDHYQYRYPPPDRFIVVPTGSLDPFASFGKCANPRCRLLAADEFVKTVALYADSVVLPDPFTTLFQAPAAKIGFEYLFELLALYQHVSPLVRDGIIRFASPIHRYCPECGKRVMHRTSDAVERVADEASQGFELNFIEKGSRTVVGIKSPILYGDPRHPLLTVFVLSQAETSELRRCSLDGTAESRAQVLAIVRPKLKAKLAQDIGNILFDAEVADHARAVLVGSSRLEMLCLADVDNSRPSLGMVEDWEDMRSVQLPWVHELTPEECLVVRAEARAALPKLRALLRARLAGADSDHDSRVQHVVAELRAQAAEVEEEIRSISQLGESRYRVAMEGLAVSMVVYGLASGVPAVTAAGLGALLAGMAHVQSGAREVGKRSRELITAPAFVLAKAKEVLRQRQAEPTPNNALLHRSARGQRKRRR